MHTVLKSVFFALVFLSCAFTVSAQEKQVLSVTPPLFQLTALPGDVWQSSVKVVNSNPYPLTVYAEVVNFEAYGEQGQGRFMPIKNDATDAISLADWIELHKGPYTIEPEQTQDITFFAKVPEDAAPGGHYAAVLISTEEPEKTGQISVQTSQVVTSLLFLRIQGDIQEKGTIREFRVLDSVVSVPEVDLSLRFENKGNVHLQPRGDIVITNMWGTERGKIPINYQTHFGNVLPNSIRDFSFAWKSDFKITDIGRYKAVATLGYGEDGVKSTTSITYFWVIPIKWTLITLAVLALFIFLIVRIVRAYIRRMLMLAGVDPESTTSERGTASSQIPPTHKTYRTVSAPIRDGVLDLRKRLDTVEESQGVMLTVIDFVRSYKRFFISLLVLIGIFVTLSLYIGTATQNDQSYQVEINEGDSTTTLTDDDVDSITNE